MGVLTGTVVGLYAQEVKPQWAVKTINPPAGANYIFVIGRGEGNSRVSAKKQAEYNAIKSSSFELGAYGIGEQELQDIETKGLDMVISMQRMPRRWITEQFVENKIKTDKTETIEFICFIAYAVKRNMNGIDDLYSIDLSLFEDKSFIERLEKEYRKKTDDFYAKGRDTYLALTILDISPIPFSMGVGFSGRHLGKIGLGYEFTFGFATNLIAQTLTYLGKIRFYVYKNFFIQSGFGALGIRSIIDKSEYTYDEFYFGYLSEEDKEQIAEILENNYIMYGIPVQIGYDLLAKNNLYMSFRGGIGYDIVMKRTIPQINIGIGVKL